jgi:hypothetical protein
MSFVIDVPEHLRSLMEVLPRHTCATIHLMLARIAELAAHWPLDDWRWKQIAYRDDHGLRFYAQGCCVRFSLEPETRRVVVLGVGRVRVHLSAERLDSDTGTQDAPAQP